MGTVHLCARALFLSGALMLLAVPAARAAYIINVDQVGSNVVTTGNGSFDTTDLGFLMSSSTRGQMQPDVGTLWLGPTSNTPGSDFAGASGPASLGPGSTDDASSGSGPFVGVFGGGQIYVPQGYVSGTTLATTTDTYPSETLSSLGITPGTYVYTWGSGPDADSLTVNVVAPEPTSLSLLGLTSLALLRRRQRASLLATNN